MEVNKTILLEIISKEMAIVIENYINKEVEYMTINNLGNPEKQHTVKSGRGALELYYKHFPEFKND